MFAEVCVRILQMLRVKRVPRDRTDFQLCWRMYDRAPDVKPWQQLAEPIERRVNVASALQGNKHQMVNPTSVPTHLACAGYSQSAIEQARGVAKATSRPTANSASSQQLCQPLLAQSDHQSLVHHQPAQVTTAQHPTAARSNYARVITATSIATQQLSHAAYEQIKSQQTQSSSISQSIRCHKDIGSSQHLTNSVLATSQTPSLVSLDLEAIAYSSVGGNGVPRPECRFMACKNGDGLAIYERGFKRSPKSTKCASTKPLPNTTSMQSFSTVTITGDDLDVTAQGQDASSELQQYTPEQQRNSPHKQRSKKPAMPGLFGQVSSPNGPPHVGLTPWQPPSPDHKRPDIYSNDTAHQDGWSAPPGASFLSAVPPIPGGLRVECGHNVEKQFMLASPNKQSQKQQSSNSLSIVVGPQAEGSVMSCSQKRLDELEKIVTPAILQASNASQQTRRRFGLPDEFTLPRRNVAATGK